MAVSADRPGEGTGSEVLDRGVIQWEMGFECLHTLGMHLLTTPTALFRFGLHKRVELRLEYTGELMVILRDLPVCGSINLYNSEPIISSPRNYAFFGLGVTWLIFHPRI